MSGRLLRGIAVIIAGFIFAASAAHAQSDPPGRVGRLAFTQGTVSFREAQEADWSAAVVNMPMTSGDTLWTEGDSHGEVSLAGTRIRLEGSTQLEMRTIDDRQILLELAQGRIDVKSFALDTSQPYQIVTPRGTVTLLAQGDYYVEAGTTEDSTILGVRSGAAQIETAGGQVLAVRAGEMGEIAVDGGMPRLQKLPGTPPPLPAYWADRDRQIVYDQPQYLSASVSGYEDLQAYGAWSNDPDYGWAWAPRAMPAGWAPYHEGHWAYVRPWGWTWIDNAPWGFAPYHYGRWANRDGRWLWCPPDRGLRPVYAPALVAFVGGVELALTLGDPNIAPVGWFPLGPHEAYVPPYSADRDYYRRLNAGAHVPQPALDERWQRAERHEPINVQQLNERLVNHRFAAVVPAEDFAHSRPVAPAAVHATAERLMSAPSAPVAAPPAPGHSLARPTEARTNEPKHADVPVAPTHFAAMPAISRPTYEKPRSPGPSFTSTRAAPPAATPRPALPAVPPRTAAVARPAPQQHPAPPPRPAPKPEEKKK
jgi:hypothetical protein